MKGEAVSTITKFACLLTKLIVVLNSFNLYREKVIYLENISKYSKDVQCDLKCSLIFFSSGVSSSTLIKKKKTKAVKI